MSLTIAYYPAFGDAAALTDRYWRAVHYLGPVNDRISAVEMAAGEHRPGPPPDYLDPTLAERAATLAERVRFVTAPSVGSADLVLVWDKTRAADPALHAARRTAVLDPAMLHEGDLAIELGASLKPRTAEAQSAAQEKLKAVIEQDAAAIAHVFGTGPSLAALDSSAIPPGVAIVCNSLVKNQALLARIKPRFITAVDPIFHAGPSRHAGAFRADLVRALEAYRPWFVIQERDAHVYEALLPERLRDLILPIPVRFARAPNLDLARRPWLTATRNVLTLTMLPLAACLAREIRVYGCDGRPAEQDDHFWSYAPDAVFDAELTLQKAAHPGFFTLNYADYYALHCETVRRWAGAIERRGGAVRAGAPSFIPALNARRLPGVASTGGAPLSFEIRGRGAYLARMAQSAYGALLAAPGAPAWLKGAARAVVSGLKNSRGGGAALERRRRSG